MRRWRAICTALVAALIGTGCATVPGPASPADPYESFNRAVWNFNDAVDSAVVKPVAIAYTKVVPSPARTCVSNVFNNVGDLWSAVNSLLQGKPGECANTVMRFAVNTTFGFAGCIDIASSINGLERKNEDFGQTLGKWGIGSGPYLVLPFFGPSSVRDGFGFLVDRSTDPVAHIHDVPTRNTAQGVRLISVRAGLLDAERIVEGAALDRYTFIRDAYLQRRRNQIYDGNPPENAAPAYDDPDAPAPPAAQ